MVSPCPEHGANVRSRQCDYCDRLRAAHDAGRRELARELLAMVDAAETGEWVMVRIAAARTRGLLAGLLAKGGEHG